MAWSAGLVILAGCSSAPTELEAGTTTPGSGRLEASIDATLAGTYRSTTSFETQDASGAPTRTALTASPPECMPTTTQPTVIDVDPTSHVMVSEDPASHQVQGITDGQTYVVYLPKANFPDPTIVTAPWVEVAPDANRTAVGLVLQAGIFIPAPDATSFILGRVRRSVANAVDEGPEDLGGVPTTRLTVTVDPTRYNAALSTAPTTVDRPTALDDPIPSIEAWIDQDGHLRKVRSSSPLRPSTPIPGEPSSAQATTAVTTIELGAFGEPLPAAIPAAADVADLGAQPAAVLLPRAGCEQGAVSINGASTPETEAWMACRRQEMVDAIAGKTVDEYAAEHPEASSGGSVADLGGTSSCPSPFGAPTGLNPTVPPISVTPGG